MAELRALEQEHDKRIWILAARRGLGRHSHELAVRFGDHQKQKKWLDQKSLTGSSGSRNTNRSCCIYAFTIQ